MKKIALLALIFCAAMFSQVHAEAATMTREEAACAIINRMFGDYALEGYCVHQSGNMHFTAPALESPALCLLEVNVQGSGFADVKISGESIEENESVMYAHIRISLAKHLGIIAGYGDGVFKPKQAIRYKEAVRMLVSAIKYDSDFDKANAYPKAYVSKADELGITKGMHYKPDDIVSAEDFALMLQRTFDTPSTVDILMQKFAYPTSARESAEMYAKALQQRNGVVQYLLLNYELSQTMRSQFEESMWVTGTSSSWADSYSIEESTNGRFKITFKYSDSTGSSSDKIVYVTVEAESGKFNITDIR